MKIAITGTIGSGKSTVCDYIKSQGFHVFSCDEYNSKLLEVNNEGFNFIKNNFPEAIINNKLDRQKVANIIFNNTKSKKMLESFLHPFILKQMLKEAKENNIFFAEVPLLFEVGYQKYFDLSILVVSDEEIAINRLIDRGLDKTKAKERILNQMSISDKQKLADEIIYNNNDLSILYKNVDNILNKYVR